MSGTTEGSLRAPARVVVVVALVVTLAAAVLSVVGIVRLARNSGSGDGTSPSSAAAVTALTDGGQLAVDFTSFDYRTLTKNFTETANRATPTFAKTYLQQSRLVASVIRKAKAVSVSQVVATGLSAFDPAKGTATVIVALNDTTKNTKSPDGTVQYFRMQVQMVKQGGAWVASAVTPE
jgi:Mce-associated membrane protein